MTSVVRTATFLFAAGQETTARLLGAALKHLAEHPELQDELRGDRDRIPDFLEEVLRVESPVKADFRLARRTTTVGGVDIPAGTPVMLLNGAANRDPAPVRVPGTSSGSTGPTPGPHRLRPRRPLVPRRPAGPGRGPGQPRAHPRPDAATSASSEEHHGPAGDRRFGYEPTWILRGLTNLHLEFDAARTATQ